MAMLLLTTTGPPSAGSDDSTSTADWELGILAKYEDEGGGPKDDGLCNTFSEIVDNSPWTGSYDPDSLI